LGVSGRWHSLKFTAVLLGFQCTVGAFKIFERFTWRFVKEAGRGFLRGQRCKWAST
jgi:hypothetical protein